MSDHSDLGFLKQPPGFSTKAIHVGQDPDQWKSGCVVPPIINSTTFKQDAPAEHRGFEYGRSGNPTRNVLEECLASLDNGKHALCFSSGLGVSSCVTALFKSGDHFIAEEDLYGGTGRFFRNVANRMGIEVTFVDTSKPENLKAAIRENTKMVWVETPTNPLLKIVDISSVSEICKKENLVLIVDNTFLTSYFQRPLELGADIVVYSLTKYMNGHSDVIMGAAVINRDDLHERLRYIQNAMGVVPAPFDCYQVNRSLKTLALRMNQHMRNSLKIAEWLQNHKLVKKVIHPGLKSHPQHELSKSQTYGYSGMLSFYIDGGIKEARNFLKSLKVFTLAESLGGYESLAELPSVMTHASVPEDLRIKLGISDNLIRLSVGLEDADDLIKDLNQAFEKVSSI